VGPIKALAFAVTIGDVTRFAASGQVDSCLGLIPREHSSGGKQRLDAITMAFSRPGASRGASAFPQIRIVSLVENGRHVLFGSQIDGNLGLMA
jgi:hypothetical protein